MEPSEQNLPKDLTFMDAINTENAREGVPFPSNRNWMSESWWSKVYWERTSIGSVRGKSYWDCTTCKTFTLRCPRGMKPRDLVIGMRGILVEGDHIPKTLIEAMESVYKHGTVDLFNLVQSWNKLETKLVTHHTLCEFRTEVSFQLGIGHRALEAGLIRKYSRSQRRKNGKGTV